MEIPKLGVEQNIQEQHEAALVSELLALIPEYRESKKFAYIPGNGMKAIDCVALLSRQERLAGLDLSVKEYDGVPHVRVSWEHLDIVPESSGETRLRVKQGGISYDAWKAIIG